MEPFMTKGSELSFSDRENLLQFLGDVDVSVPGRTEGRRSHHRERDCMVHYLQTLAGESLLEFPLKIVRSESPDFFLNFTDCSVAVEIRDVGTERSQEATTLLERSPVGTFLEGEASLVRPGEALQHPGYKNNEGETELAGLILDALDDKAETINGPHFQAADFYDLLLYDNSHLVLVTDFKALRPILDASIGTWQSRYELPRRIRQISVLRDSELLYDCGGATKILTVRKCT